MPTPPKALRPRPDDLALFTGRREERRLLGQIFDTLLGKSAAPAPLLTQFHGLGGIGKSFLRRWAEHRRDQLPSAERKRLHLAAINLDVAQVWTPAAPVPDFWWQVRMAVSRAGISTILFDDLYFTLWKRLHPGHAGPEHKGFFGDLLEGVGKDAEGAEIAAQADEALAGLKENLKDLGDTVKGLKLISSLATYLRDRHRQRYVKETIGFDPASLDEAQQVNRLPEFLARDVQEFLLARADHSIVLLVDGFERVQSVTCGDDLQHSFERFCGSLALGGAEARRAAVVVFGRDPLTWGTLYSDPDWPRHWALHHLAGWPEADARAFLLAAEAEYDQLGDPGTAMRIRQHTEAILRAAYSEKDGPVIGSWHPFHLALAVDMVADHGAGFTEEMLGRTPDELIERFSRYLASERRRACQLFALAVDFDEPLFRFLVEGHLLPGWGVTQFAEAASPWASYVTESRTTPGRYRFHRLMQEMLLRSLRADDDVLATARQDLAALLAHFLEASRFVNEAVLDASKLAAYARGVEILLYHAEDSLGNPPSPPGDRALLTPTQVEEWFGEYQHDFAAGSRAILRLPFYQRFASFLKMALGQEAQQTAYAYNELAMCYSALAAFAEAEPLIRCALRIAEGIYGPEHPNVATALNNLAQLFKDTNRLAEAEPLMRRALAIDERSYGPDHPEVATILNNLAQLLQDTNRLTEAERLMRRALAIDERSHGPDHPKVAIRLNNLAQLLQATNRLAEAERLMRRALAIDEGSYGLDHPNVATALSNFASFLQHTNRLAEAEPLTRRALTIAEVSHGPDHPMVATTLNNFAFLLLTTNRLAEAEPLMWRALVIDEGCYGPEHPEVATNLKNLASLLQATNRLADAEPLMRRAVEILLQFTSTTGHQHPHLHEAVSNYVGLLAETGLTEPQVQAKLNELGRSYGV